MNSRPLQIAQTLVVALFVSGCATLKVDYQAASVPDEQGLAFTRITDSSEHVFAPSISVSIPRRGISLDGEHSWFAVSRDGRFVAYIGSPGNKSTVSVRNLGWDKSVSVHQFEGNITDIAFSPNSKSLAVSVCRGGRWEVGLIHIDSAQTIQKLAAPIGEVSQPEFAPDGKSLFYVVHPIPAKVGQVFPDETYLWRYDFATGRSGRFARGMSPSCFPDGRRVAFVLPATGSAYASIWIFDRWTNHPSQLATSKDRGYLQPAVSPDGKRIAFVSKSSAINVPLNLDIAVMNSDGSHSRQLTFHSGHDIFPHWSTDGKSIYFLSQRGSDSGQWNIWRVDLKQ
jgi:Tol biopolymer transport system component